MRIRQNVWITSFSILFLSALTQAEMPKVSVVVEETVYKYLPPNNGSGPLWSYGNTQIARLGNDVFVSQQETGEGVPLLCNTRWKILKRGDSGWTTIAEPAEYGQREPCPIGTVSSHDLILNVNDSRHPAGEMYAKCEPALIHFVLGRSSARQTRLTPKWVDTPYYTDHSYRGYAVDAKHKRLLMLNIDAKTSVENACLMNMRGKTLANGSITFPIRSCYPQVALDNKKVSVLAISDIVEPVAEWQQYKFEQTQRKWDYVFRILYFACTPDLTRQDFATPLEIANVDATGGAISNQDLWISPTGEAYLLYTQREVQSAMLRDKFFPEKSIINSLRLAIVKEGQIVSRQVLLDGSEKDEPGWARFHVTAKGNVYAVIYHNAQGGQNALMRIYPTVSTEMTPIPLSQGIGSFCLASVRAGNRPSDRIDLHGTRGSDTMVYAQIHIEE